MKKLISCIMLIIFVITLNGCSLFNPNSGIGNKPETNTKDPSNSDTTNDDKNSDPNKGTNNDENESNGTTSTYKIKDYFPIKENTLYIYEGTGNEFAGYTLWVDYIKNDKVQQRINNGGTELAKVLENKNGELKVLFTREENYYREDFTSKQPNKNETLLKEPLVKGTNWTLTDGKKRSITNINVDVSTPSGNYKALEVTTENSDSQNIDYYVLNIGLVKSVFKSKDTEVTSSLKEIQNNSSLTQNVDFYYPNNVKDKIFLVKKKLVFKSNDITKMTFEKEFRNVPNNELIKLIGPNVKINSMYLNDDGMVYVDFTKNFVAEMNVGAGYEGMILQSITNTIGKYYGVNKVYITLDGQPYSSGHIIKKKGEAFKVDTENIVEPE